MSVALDEDVAGRRRLVFHPPRLRRLAAVATPVACLLAIAAWPLTGGPLALHLGSVIAIYVIAVVGLDLVVGRTGLLHLGYGVFFGAGAYTVGLAAQYTTAPDVLFLLGGIAIAVVLSALLALVLSETSGYVLALLTLATASVCESLVRNVPGFGGTSGLGGISRNLVGTGELDSETLYVVLAVLAIVVLALYRNVRHSRIGRALEGLRLAPQIAEGSGVRLNRLRFKVMLLSAAVGGLAGGLFAVSEQFVSPDVVGPAMSINFLVMDVVGGLGVFWSAVPGTIFVRGLPQVVQQLGDYQLVIVGVVTVIVAVWFRRGVAGTLEQGWSALMRAAGIAARPSAVVREEVRAAQRTEEPVVSVRSDVAPQTLVVDDLSVRFGGLLALECVSLTLVPGEVTALVGPNGSGKTTLINCIAGSVRREAGRILLGGEDVSGVSTAWRVRRGITRTFQLVSLCSSLTVLENVMLGGHTLGRAGLTRALLPVFARREERTLRDGAIASLESLGIAALAGRLPPRLSSGQRRLVEIARCLMTDAAVVLLDEPAAGLNPDERRHLVTVIRALASANRTVLLVEHDMEFVMGLADTIVVLTSGTVLMHGDAQSVRNDPRVVEAYWGRRPAA